MSVILGGFSANCAQDKPCETTEAPTASIFNAVKKTLLTLTMEISIKCLMPSVELEKLGERKMFVKNGF